jgi:chaperonin cofactor prefoldin
VYVVHFHSVILRTSFQAQIRIQRHFLTTNYRILKNNHDDLMRKNGEGLATMTKDATKIAELQAENEELKKVVNLLKAENEDKDGKIKELEGELADAEVLY